MTNEEAAKLIAQAHRVVREAVGAPSEELAVAYLRAVVDMVKRECPAKGATP